MRIKRARDVLGDSSSVALLLASLCRAAGNADRAEAHLQSAGGGGEGPAKVELDLADLQIRTGRSQQAMLTLCDALRRHWREPILHLRMGLLYARQEDYSQARKHLSFCVQFAPKNADGHYWLGMCHAVINDPAQAAMSLARAHELRPDRVVWAYQLAQVTRAAADRGIQVDLPIVPAAAPADKSSLAGLVETICRDSEIVLAMLAVPESDADEELFGSLCGLLELALEQHPNRADLHHRQSLVLDRMGQLDEAIKHARRAVAINPQYVQAHILLGSLLAESEPAIAQEHLKCAIAAGGDYADVHVRLAEIAKQAGKVEQARAELERALEINSDYEQAREALEALAAA